MADYPEALIAFQKGETQISHIAMIGNRITPANANVILEGIKNKSKREVEDLLSRVSSNGLIREHEPIIEKTFRMTESQAAVFDRVLEVIAARGRVATSVEGLLKASETYLNQYDPMRIAEKAAEREAIRNMRLAQAKQDSETTNQKNPCETPDTSDVLPIQGLPDTNEAGKKCTSDELNTLTPLERIRSHFKNKRLDPRRPIRASVRNRVWLRDEGQCTFHYGNGERCKERKMLEIDHKIMVCRGGTNDESNLILRCRHHNQFLAELELGKDFMAMKRRSSNGYALRKSELSTNP